MANLDLDGLDPADALDGTEKFYALQSGSDRAGLVSQILAYVEANLPPPVSVGVRTITAGFDAGRVNGVDQTLATGLRVELRAPYGLEPTAWTLLPKAGSTGNITIEIRTRPFSSGSFAAITDGSPPSISSGARGTASASTWDAIADGELIEFEITALTGFVSGITLIVEATEV